MNATFYAHYPQLLLVKLSSQRFVSTNVKLYYN